MKKLFGIFLALLPVLELPAQEKEFVLQTGRLGAEIQSTMYGLFFEDINYAADGGVYAELVKNRSFEFPQPFMGWQTFGAVTLQEDGPFDRNPHYVRLSAPDHPHRQTGLDNEGFFGIGIRKDREYRFSVWARTPENQGGGSLRIELVDLSSGENQQAVAAAELSVDTQEWKRYQVLLTPSQTLAKARLRVFLTSDHTVDLEHVSLFPKDTWKGRENGLRKDLVEALADLKPGVLRFPGGCIVEGTDLETRYNWKNSVGPVENRPLNQNRWQYCFPHRFFPDYYQSYGLGFYEFFLLSEDLGAEPLPVLSCGLACQFQNTDLSAHQPVDQLDDYIQDALDLIEFANGPVTSKWGALRAEMGHPDAFGMKYIGIGNEQWGPEYPERLEPFVVALRKAHPEIRIVGSSGPAPSGEKFDQLWPEMKRIGVDLVDEHYYRPEGWFLSQGARYDSYDREGPAVFAGEYACHGRGRKFNHFHAALMEAALMTGLERNADIVKMATYAPLFAHVEGWQWRPDLIWFNGLESVRTASYLVQQLYSTNRGTHVLPLTCEGQPVTGSEGQDGLFASAVWDEFAGAYIVKVVNTSAQHQQIRLVLEGMKKKEVLTSGRQILFQSADLYQDNTLDVPDRIRTVTAELEVSGQEVLLEAAPKTFSVFTFRK